MHCSRRVPAFLQVVCVCTVNAMSPRTLNIMHVAALALSILLSLQELTSRNLPSLTKINAHSSDSWIYELESGLMLDRVTSRHRLHLSTPEPAASPLLHLFRNHYRLYNFGFMPWSWRCASPIETAKPSSCLCSQSSQYAMPKRTYPFDSFLSYDYVPYSQFLGFFRLWTTTWFGYSSRFEYSSSNSGCAGKLKATLLSQRYRSTEFKLNQLKTQFFLEMVRCRLDFSPHQARWNRRDLNDFRMQPTPMFENGDITSPWLEIFDTQKHTTIYFLSRFRTRTGLGHRKVCNVLHIIAIRATCTFQKQATPSNYLTVSNNTSIRCVKVWSDFMLLDRRVV